MFRMSLGEGLFQASITALFSSLAFVHTETYELTTLGKTVFILVVITLIAIIRSALVPVHPTAAARPAPTDQAGNLPGKEQLAQSDLPTFVVFVILMYGIVKWSWFGILPRLAAEIGLPVSPKDQVTIALSIGLLVGTVALAASGIVDILQTRKRASLGSREPLRSTPTSTR